jgi:anti-sigma B factor antagonist
MAIELTLRRAGSVTIVDIRGRMVAGADGQKLHTGLLEVFEQGNPWILVNCADLAFVDSSGLGDLIAAHAAIVKRGGVARLLHPGEALAGLLARTRLDALIDIYDDESAAFASFTDANNELTQQKLAGYIHRDT